MSNCGATSFSTRQPAKTAPSPRGRLQRVFRLSRASGEPEVAATATTAARPRGLFPAHRCWPAASLRSKPMRCEAGKRAHRCIAARSANYPLRAAEASVYEVRALSRRTEREAAGQRRCGGQHHAVASQREQDRHTPRGAYLSSHRRRLAGRLLIDRLNASRTCRPRRRSCRRGSASRAQSAARGRRDTAGWPGCR